MAPPASRFSPADISGPSTAPPTQQFAPSDMNMNVQPSDGTITSDEDEKDNFHDIDKYQTQNFLDALKAHTYQYKDQDNGRGKFMGVMAQDLEKTPLGKQAVVDTPKGKMVDYARLAQTMLGSTVMLNDKVNKLELKLKGRN